jgi:hypothetical protein
MSQDDELVEELLASVSDDVNGSLDREKLKSSLLEAFGQVRKKPVSQASLQIRLDQICSLAESMRVSFDKELNLIVEPGSRDWLVFQLLKIGCEWHESIDIENAVRQSM